MKKVEYWVSIKINGRFFNKIIISQYYKQKHPEVNDKIILELLKTLDPDDHYVVAMENPPFQYFRIEPVFHNHKPYRLVLLINEEENYLGVINAFRIRKKYE